MPFPRPASPRALWADLRTFWSTRPRHQWVAAFFAVLIPIGIVTAFFFDTRSGIVPREQVMFIDSWPTTRTDAEIKAKQKSDAAAREAARRARQREFQRLDESLNRMGI
ncbi:MAG TPA: hypothetical protein VES64_02370 [Allosphingosinicella sp.]|nr:hypothetical protein [Allosphingosinicella sp.]